MVLSGLCLGFTANAADRGSFGQSTQQWLDLQKSSEQAPADERPLDGDVAKRTYQRYLKSFEAEIPQEFETGVKVE